MSLDEFSNGIRVLWNLNRSEYLDCINETDRAFITDPVLWHRFVNDRIRTFLKLPTQDQERIFKRLGGSR